MTVGKNISTTSGLGNCSKSSNRDPGVNQASDEGSDFESEANSRPDSPGEQKTKGNEPPSKMQKIDSTNSGTGTLHLNEQRPKQQSCISFQKEMIYSFVVWAFGNYQSFLGEAQEACVLWCEE